MRPDRNLRALVGLMLALLPAWAQARQVELHRPASSAAPQVPAQSATPGSQEQAPADLLWRTTDAETSPLFSLVGVRLGPDQDGSASWAAHGRFFAPFARRSALQVEGRYDWYHDRREGQLDSALVNRVRDVQLGLFASARYVTMEAYNPGRWLSQMGVTVDYMFAAGRVGAFATAPLRHSASLGRQLVRGNVYDEASLRLVDQVGAAWHLDVRGRLDVEGHLSSMKPAGRDRTTGGSLLVVYPLRDGWALTAEGERHASLVAPVAERRLTVGVRLGAWPRAAAPSTADGPGPIEIPAVRYRLASRRVRDGNDGPIADAGLDQVIAPKCPDSDDCHVTVTLDAGGSGDPDGDPLKYLWTGRAGFAAGQGPQPADARRTMFEGRPGHTYVIRLTVTDDRGAVAIDEVAVTILERRQ